METQFRWRGSFSWEFCEGALAVGMALFELLSSSVISFSCCQTSLVRNQLLARGSASERRNVLGWMDRCGPICAAVNERLYVIPREKNAIRESVIRQTSAGHQSRDGVPVEAQKFRHLPAGVENRRIHGATSVIWLDALDDYATQSKARQWPQFRKTKNPTGGPVFSSTLVAKLAELPDSCQRFIRCQAVPSGGKVCDLCLVKAEASPALRQRRRRGLCPCCAPFRIVLRCSGRCRRVKISTLSR